MPVTAMRMKEGCHVSRALDSIPDQKNSLTPNKVDVKRQINEKSINSTNFDAYDRILCNMSASADGDITQMVNVANDEEVAAASSKQMSGAPG